MPDEMPTSNTGFIQEAEAQGLVVSPTDDAEATKVRHRRTKAEVLESDVRDALFRASGSSSGSLAQIGQLQIGAVPITEDDNMYVVAPMALTKAQQDRLRFMVDALHVVD